MSIKVAVPNMADKPEWRLHGQMLSLALPLTDTVAVVKARIHEETGMPPGKQKLSWEVSDLWNRERDYILNIK